MPRYKIITYINDKEILDYILFLGHINKDSRNQTVSKIVVQSILDNKDKIDEALEKMGEVSGISVESLKKKILNDEYELPEKKKDEYPDVFGF